MAWKFQHPLCQNEVLHIFISFISPAPHETTACPDFWNAAPILFSQALLPGLQLHNQFLWKCKSLKWRSMERNIKDFIIFSQNSVRIKSPSFPSQTTTCTLFHLILYLGNQATSITLKTSSVFRGYIWSYGCN